jgi:CheY-like chemotaxis protein
VDDPRSAGPVVATACSAAEALLALEGSMPDVLLSDVVMPGQSERALASGFKMQLHKPIDPEALIAAVAVLAEVGA